MKQLLNIFGYVRFFLVINLLIEKHEIDISKRDLESSGHT